MIPFSLLGTTLAAAGLLSSAFVVEGAQGRQESISPSSGYEYNSPTCDTADQKQLSDYAILQNEALYPLGASSYVGIPSGCVPPTADNNLLGAWYSLNIPAATSEKIILNTTFYTDGSTNDPPDRDHYLAVLQGDDCAAGATMMAASLECVAFTYWHIANEAILDFNLTTNTSYYLFIAMVNNGNFDAPTMGIVPTCEDENTKSILNTTAVGDSGMTGYCAGRLPLTLTAAPTPAPSLVATPLALGDETPDFDLILEEPRLFSVALQGQAGMLTCFTTPDDDTGDTDLYVGIDSVPSEQNYNCSSEQLGTSHEECSIFVSAASVAYVLMMGNQEQVEVSCKMDSEGTKINVGVDMITDNFNLLVGEYQLYHIDAPDGTMTVSCSGNAAGLGLHMKDRQLPIPNAQNDCDTNGTNDPCRVSTGGGDDVYILVEGISSVPNGRLSCEVVMNPILQSRVGPGDAVSLDLNDDDGFELLKNQRRVFRARVPAGSTDVSCRVSTSETAVTYGMTALDGNVQSPFLERDNCQIGVACEHSWSGGITSQESDVYVTVTAAEAARANIRCDADELRRRKIDVGVDMTSGRFNLDDGAFRLYYIDAPRDTYSVSCSANNQGLGVHMKDGGFPVLRSDTDCDTIGTSLCEVFTSGGDDVYILVEAIRSVTNGELSCIVTLDPSAVNNIDEDDARTLGLGDDFEFALLRNEVKVFHTRVPQAATKVSCQVSTGYFATLSYTVTVSEPNRAVSIPHPGLGDCRAGVDCEHFWSGGNPEVADVYVAVTTSEPAIADITCEAEQLDVQGGAQFLVWGDEEDDKTLIQGEATLFYLIVPVNTEEIICRTRASQGDLDLYVRQFIPPTQFDYDCIGYSVSAEEECSFVASSRDFNTILYVEIRGYEFSLNVIEDAAVTCNAYGPGISYGRRRGNPDFDVGFP